MPTMQANLPKEEALKLCLSSVYEKFGYQRYKLSGFEEYSFYSDNRSFLADEGFIAFNNADGKLMALKPDITLSIVKSAASQSARYTRAYYNESVYRSAGRESGFREMGQIGLEILGDVGDYGMAEVILLAIESLSQIDKEYILSLSHMSFIKSVEDHFLPDLSQHRLFEEAVKNKSTHAIEETLKKADVPAKEIERICKLFAVSGSLRDAIGEIEAIAVPTEKEALEDLRALEKSLKMMQLDGHVQLDLSLLHTIDYYNGIIFEGYVKKVPFPVLSGGRYDLLADKFKKDMQGAGFAVYLDNLNLYYPIAKEYDADILILAHGDDTGKLIAAVSQFVAEGKSVRVEQSIPAGFRAKKVLQFEDGAIKEEL